MEVRDFSEKNLFLLLNVPLFQQAGQNEIKTPSWDEVSSDLDTLPKDIDEFAVSTEVSLISGETETTEAAIERFEIAKAKARRTPTLKDWQSCEETQSCWNLDKVCSEKV